LNISIMRDQMLNHGLDQPLLGTDTGYFQVTFPGPGENLDRIRVPEARLTITPAIEAQLTERQKQILQQVVSAGYVTNAWCRQTFGRAYFAIYRDLDRLQELNLIQREGKARATRYILKVQP
jgi:ATP-dependent DNA helicase RecG